MLHITNGDSAAGTITQCGVSGDVLPWRDVLHEGPVPSGLELEALSEVRARFIAGAGWAPEQEVAADFARRDARVRQVSRNEDVVLWFEADLYDQLQLIQLLDWFLQHPPRSLNLICIGEHPAIPRFVGLGQLTPAQMADLFPHRTAVTPAQLELGRDAWRAFTAASPLPLAEFLAGNTAALPFLGPALSRMLEEYPSLEGGTGRSERQVLAVLNEGADSFQSVFPATQAMESRPFMGDLTLWTRIGDLATNPAPAIRLGMQPAKPGSGPAWVGTLLELTSLGQAYLGKTADLVREHGINRWMGGVHLSGHEAQWRWDDRRRMLVSTAKS